MRVRWMVGGLLSGAVLLMAAPTMAEDSVAADTPSHLVVTKTPDPTSVPEPGADVTFSIVVTNTSGVSVSLDTLDDDVFGDLDGQGDCDVSPPIVLAPLGDSYACTFVGAVTGDASGPDHQDTVTAAAVVAGTGQIDTAVATATVTITDVPPQIIIDKIADPAVVRVGGTVTYNYAVTNPGTEPLQGVTVTDDKCSPVSFVDGDTDSDSRLDKGETWRYRCTMPVSVDTTNVATATGSDDDGNTAQDTDDAVVDVINPVIAIVKTADPVVTRPGQTVTYSYAVTNPGDEPLSNVVVVDDKCSPVQPKGGDTDGDGKLDPGETWSYTCTIIASAAAGDLTNIATATGTDRLGGTVSSTDDATIAVVLATPSIAVDKTVDRPVVRAGSTVIYSYAVINDGAPENGVVEPLLRVSVTDDKCSPVTFVSGDTDGDSELDAGETWRYTCTTTVSVDTTNEVTAIGFHSDGTQGQARDTAFVAVFDPRIDIVKTASGTTVFVGDKVTYTYVVTNPGNEPLSNVVVSDDKCAPAAYDSGDTNGDGKLDPGERWTFSCSKTASEIDGTNIGTVTGLDRLGGAVSANDTETIRVELPRTGASSARWTFIGGEMILLGLALVLVTRPNRSVLGRRA